MLEGDELVIGRASDNPVSIPDTSVSRKHALVRKTADGWAVSDLGSGNGTLLNGEAVADETPLSEGDVITLGDTELRFSSGGGAPVRARAAEAADDGALAPRRAPVRTARNGGAIERSTGRGRPVRTSRMAEDPLVVRARRRKLMLIALGATFVLVALIVGGKAIKIKIDTANTAKAAAAAAHEREMSELFAEAKGLVRVGKWTEARERLAALRDADPEWQQMSQVESYLARADEEIPNQRLLELATQQTTAGELGKASATLAKVKTSTQEDALEAARTALDAKVTERLAEARQIAQAAATTRDVQELERLKAIVEDILVVREGDREAAELKQQAEAAINRIKNPTQAPVRPDTPWIEVQQRYKSGDVAGALSFAQACAGKFAQCRKLETDMREFETKSKRLEDLSENELIALYELDKTIAGGSSSDVSRSLRTQLVSKLFVKASQMKTMNRWAQAIEFARRVLQADPGHVGAQSLITEGRSQAHEIYLRGYQLKETNPDEAVRLFKEVIAMTPADDENNQKARARINDIQNRQ